MCLHDLPVILTIPHRANVPIKVNKNTSNSSFRVVAFLRHEMFS